MPLKREKPRLSRGILEMKFMQRTKKKVDDENEAAEGRTMYANEITERMLNSNSNFIIEPSFTNCEALIEGRLSFRGMNPEIERLLELEKAEREAEKGHKQPTEVSDKEMLAFYYAQQAPAATKAMKKKFQKNKRKMDSSDSDDDNNNSTTHKCSDHGSDLVPEADNHSKKAKRKKKTKFRKPKEDEALYVVDVQGRDKY